VPYCAWLTAHVTTPSLDISALMSGSCHMDPGNSQATLPRSSGCSSRVSPGFVTCCADKAFTVKSTSSLASFTCFFVRPWSQGNPRGNTLERTGLGPCRFAWRARENVPHGGEDTTKKNSPSEILLSRRFWRALLRRSWRAPPRRTSISVTLTLMPVPRNAFFSDDARPLRRFAPAKR
jgi:hypothetical protein